MIQLVSHLTVAAATTVLLYFLFRGDPYDVRLVRNLHRLVQSQMTHYSIPSLAEEADRASLSEELVRFLLRAYLIPIGLSLAYTAVIVAPMAGHGLLGTSGAGIHSFRTSDYVASLALVLLPTVGMSFLSRRHPASKRAVFIRALSLGVLFSIMSLVHPWPTEASWGALLTIAAVTSATLLLVYDLATFSPSGGFCGCMVYSVAIALALWVAFLILSAVAAVVMYLLGYDP